jgi:hypothetical protein
MHGTTIKIQMRQMKTQMNGRKVLKWILNLNKKYDFQWIIDVSVGIKGVLL